MFTRIHHVAIAVKSLESALRFYRDVLGLPVGCEARVPEQGVRAALLAVGPDEIELLEPVDPAGGVARFLGRRGEGLHHICLETPDIEAALAEAKRAGLPLIDQAPRAGLAGRIAFLHPKASAGVLVELAQPGESGGHAGSGGSGVRALGIETVYLAVQDLAGSAAALERHFGGRPAPAEASGALGGRAVWLGTSRLTLLGPAAAAPASPVGRLLADCGEGLCGLCLRVEDLRRAIRRLEDCGLPIRPGEDETAGAMACLDPSRASGVTLVLAACGPNDR